MLVTDSQLKDSENKLVKKKKSSKWEKIILWLSNATVRVSIEKVDDIKRGRIYRSI
jgi:hypothetical protein